MQNPRRLRLGIFPQLLALFSSIPLSAQICQPSADQNYIYTLEPNYGVTQLSEMENHPGQRTIQYYDGLNRLNQTILVGFSPQGSDLIELQQYDDQSRPEKQWLPYVVSGNGAWQPPNQVSVGVITSRGDNAPYRKTIYEPNPQNRPSQEYGPGQTWHNNGKSIRTRYATNTSSGVLSCAQYEIIGNELRQKGNYAPGQLRVITTEDEDQHRTIQFQDKEGRTVLTRAYDGENTLDTYYAYGPTGQLRYVLPPMLSPSIISGRNYNTTTPEIKKYAYYYRYDNNGRCIEKQYPGCDPICQVYDRADRPILTQTGEQRALARPQWTFIKYDKHGRIILEGIFSTTQSHGELIEKYKNTLLIEKEDATAKYQYSHTLSPKYGESYVHFTRVNYYDHDPNLEQTADPTHELGYEEKSGYDNRYTGRGKDQQGKQTGSRIMIIGSDAETIQVYYYDHQDRIIQQKETTHLGGIQKEYYHYDFSGRIIDYHHEQTLPGKPTITEKYHYTYDPAGREKSLTHTINNQSPVQLTQTTYNSYGQPYKKYHYNNQDTTTYTYTIRNQIAQIINRDFTQILNYESTLKTGDIPSYNGNLSSQKWKNGSSDWNHYTHLYDGFDRLTQSTYQYATGGISGATAINHSEQITGYDKNGNILGLKRFGLQVTGIGLPGKPSRPVKKSALIDELTCTYNGNQLQQVTEGPNAVQTLYDGANDYHCASTSTTPYTYNRNGQPTQDPNKGITGIVYNHQNLPETITIQGQTITNKYNANGTKLTQTITMSPVNPILSPLSASLDSALTLAITPQNLQIRNYINNYQYASTTLEKIQIPGGYIAVNNNTYTYHYYLHDYQGNVRVVKSQGGTILERNDYYPFGMLYGENVGAANKQPYKLLEKEYISVHGLNQYDFGARLVDSSLPIWRGFDPMAEQYYSISPYAYCGNNPMKYVDRDGKELKIYFTDVYGKQKNWIFDGNNRKEAPNNAFVKDFFAAYDYNLKNGGGDNLKKAVTSQTEIFRLAETDGTSERQSVDTKKPTLESFVFWNPKAGVETTEGYRMSPATILEHEMDHNIRHETIEDYSIYRKETRDESDPQYDKIEERRVITGSEAKTGRLNGEYPKNYMRKNHEGKSIITPSPISNQKIKYKNP